MKIANLPLLIILFVVSTTAFAQDPYETFARAFGENFNSENYGAIHELTDDNFKSKVSKETLATVLSGARAQGGNLQEIKLSENIPNGKIFHVVCERATFALTVVLDANGKASGLWIRPVPTTANKDAATIINEWKANNASAGLVVGRIREGKPEVQYYGVASKATSAPVNGESIFEIGSISKPLTGIILHTMIAEKKISLDDPVNKFLPKDAQLPKINDKDILIRHLVTHSSCLPRLPDNIDMGDSSNPYSSYSEKELFEALPKIAAQNCDPGTKSEYSNFGAGLVGYVLTRISGKTYTQLFNERIAKPLKTKSLGVIGASDKWTGGHTPSGASQAQWTFTDVIVGAGGVDASADDMTKLLTFLMKPDQSSLGKAVVASTAVQLPGQQGDLCTFWIKGGEKKVIWHNGMTGGFNAFIGWYEGTQTGVFVLTNNGGADVATGLGMAIMSELK